MERAFNIDCFKYITEKYLSLQNRRQLSDYYKEFPEPYV